MSDPETDAAMFVTRTQDHLNHYIDVADRKASILLTGQLAFLGLYANIIKPAQLELSRIDVFFITLTGLVTLIAGGFALSVVYPRTPEPKNGYMLWETILERTKEGYRSEVNDLSSQSVFNELVDENYMLAKVAAKKYRHFRYSLFATVGFVLLALISYILMLV